MTSEPELQQKRKYYWTKYSEESDLKYSGTISVESKPSRQSRRNVPFVPQRRDLAQFGPNDACLMENNTQLFKIEMLSRHGVFPAKIPFPPRGRRHADVAEQRAPRVGHSTIITFPILKRFEDLFQLENTSKFDYKLFWLAFKRIKYDLGLWVLCQSKFGNQASYPFSITILQNLERKHFCLSSELKIL